ncbi:MAG TPA: universal stress protein [Solirubrobacteraceae bacterium]|jgi:nucleotide-binding universal stress UspA family protein
MILICYDGSDDAKAAVKQAGALFDGRPTTALNVWEPFSSLILRTPATFDLISGVSDTVDLDNAGRKDAERIAQEGADLAREAGLDSSPATAIRSLSVAETIVAEGDRTDASVIVMGSRGLGGLGSFFLGSVSHAVLQRADRPVMVVPSQAVAERRSEKLGTATKTDG